MIFMLPLLCFIGLVCDSPPPVEHAYTTIYGYSLGDEMQYLCDEGWWFEDDTFVMTSQCVMSPEDLCAVEWTPVSPCKR